MKKATFTNRLAAFLIDFIIISLIGGLITQGLTTKKIEKLNNELQDVITEYTQGEMTMEDYLENTNEISYELEKASLPMNTVYVVLYIGYFIIFQFLNKGQTIGKKLMKIKVITDNKKEPSLMQIIIRTIFVDQIILNLLAIILLMLVSKELFIKLNYVITGIQYLFIIVTSIMILYRKDKLSLHDIMSKTMVVKEGK